MNNNASIQYKIIAVSLRSQKHQRLDGKTSISIRATFNGKQKFFATGVTINLNQWSDTTKRVVRHPNAADLNLTIRNIEAELMTIERNVKLRNGIITLDQLKHQFRTGNEVSTSFTDFIEDTLRSGVGHNARIEISTLKSRRKTLNKLKAFKSNIYFHELNSAFFNKFFAYLLAYKSGTGEPLNQTTIYGHYKVVTNFVNRAIDAGHIKENENPLKGVKVAKGEHKEGLYLTLYDLHELEKLNVADNPVLSTVKDFFLLGCYTGLRKSDLLSLTRDNFLIEPDGIKLTVKAQKTKKTLKFLNLRHFFPIKGETYSQAEKIVKKRLDALDKLTNKHPKHSNFTIFCDIYKNINKELKTLFMLLPVRTELKIGVGCHVSRHTFATVFAKVAPNNLPLLQTLLQHGDIRQTRDYIHRHQLMTNEEMAEIDWSKYQSI